MDKSAGAWLNGLVGMLIFSGSLPATRIAETGFAPVFLTVTRACIAALFAAVLLVAFQEKRPDRGDLASLAVVAGGVVIGFPLLTAFALRQITPAHSMMFVGLLPLATASCAVWRGGERPNLAFWLFAGLGSLIIVGFASFGGVAVPRYAGLLMVAAILVCGLGYAEGAKLARKLGGWQVICWALVLALPVTAPLMLLNRPLTLAGIGEAAWAGLFYVSMFSMLIGFVFWYRGLAQGGTARVAQLQLLQPFFGLALAAGVLHESVGWPMLAAMLAVMLCVLGARRFA